MNAFVDHLNGPLTDDDHDLELLCEDEMEKCSRDKYFIRRRGFWCAACRKRQTSDNMRICISCSEDGGVLVKPGELTMCSRFIFCANCVIDNHISKGHRQEKLSEYDHDLQSIRELKKASYAAMDALGDVYDGEKQKAETVRHLKEIIETVLLTEGDTYVYDLRSGNGCAAFLECVNILKKEEELNRRLMETCNLLKMHIGTSDKARLMILQKNPSERFLAGEPDVQWPTHQNTPHAQQQQYAPPGFYMNQRPINPFYPETQQRHMAVQQMQLPYQPPVYRPPVYPYYSGVPQSTPSAYHPYHPTVPQAPISTQLSTRVATNDQPAAPSTASTSSEPVGSVIASDVVSNNVQDAVQCASPQSSISTSTESGRTTCEPAYVENTAETVDEVPVVVPVVAPVHASVPAPVLAPVFALVPTRVSAPVSKPESEDYEIVETADSKIAGKEESVAEEITVSRADVEDEKMESIDEQTKKERLSKKFRVEKQLVNLLHAQTCFKSSCDIQGCSNMKNTLAHLTTCTNKVGCREGRCKSSKAIVAHLKRCFSGKCQLTCNFMWILRLQQLVGRGLEMNGMRAFLFACDTSNVTALECGETLGVSNSHIETEEASVVTENPSQPEGVSEMIEEVGAETSLPTNSDNLLDETVVETASALPDQLCSEVTADFPNQLECSDCSCKDEDFDSYPAPLNSRVSKSWHFQVSEHVRKDQIVKTVLQALGPREAWVVGPRNPWIVERKLHTPLAVLAEKRQFEIAEYKDQYLELMSNYRLDKEQYLKTCGKYNRKRHEVPAKPTRSYVTAVTSVHAPARSPSTEVQQLAKSTPVASSTAASIDIGNSVEPVPVTWTTVTADSVPNGVQPAYKSTLIASNSIRHVEPVPVLRAATASVSSSKVNAEAKQAPVSWPVSDNAPSSEDDRTFVNTPIFSPLPVAHPDSSTHAEVPEMVRISAGPQKKTSMPANKVPVNWATNYAAPYERVKATADRTPALPSYPVTRDGNGASSSSSKAVPAAKLRSWAMPAHEAAPERVPVWTHWTSAYSSKRTESTAEHPVRWSDKYYVYHRAAKPQAGNSSEFVE